MNAQNFCRVGVSNWIDVKIPREFNNSAFTPVELLVVIALIAIVAALMLPVLSGARARAQRTICVNNLRQISFGVRIYSDDSHDASPSSGGTNFDTLFTSYKALIKNYVGLNGASSAQDKLFACPADVFNTRGPPSARARLQHRLLRWPRGAGETPRSFVSAPNRAQLEPRQSAPPGNLGARELLGSAKLTAKFR